MNKQETKKKYSSISDLFKNSESLESIVELNLTPIEGFELRDLSDIENNKKNLTSLSKLNISDNLISKLNLKNFASLKQIQAQRNMISEVSLLLTRLVSLDLNSNMISKMIDLSNLPQLKILNLNHNLIEKIHIRELLPVKKTLCNLSLGFNKIKLEANEFIAFVEGLKVFHLELFTFEGNKFILENKSLTNNYKIFIVATIQTLIRFNDQDININRDTLNAKDIMLQILGDEREVKVGELEKVEADKEIKNKQRHFFKDEKVVKNFGERIILNSNEITPKIIPKITPEIKTNKDSQLNLLDKLLQINIIFEELNLSNGSDQILYIELMSEINYLLSNQLDENLYSQDSDLIQEEYAKFLINCHMLIELNQTLEEPIYKIIAQFALFYQGEFFAVKSFEFFHSLITGSQYRIKNITKILDTVIIRQIKMSTDLPPFKILNSIIQFYRSIEIECTELYLALISTIINHLKNFDMSLLSQKLEQEEIRNLETCIDFIRQYLKIDFPEEFEYEENNIVDEDETFNQVDNKSVSSGFVSKEENFMENNSKNDDDLIKNEYGFDLREFEDRSDIFLEENKNDEDFDVSQDVEGDEEIEYEEENSNDQNDSHRHSSKGKSSNDNNNNDNNKNNSSDFEDFESDNPLDNIDNEHPATWTYKNSSAIRKILRKNIFDFNDHLEEDKKEKYVFIFILIFRKCTKILTIIDEIFLDYNEHLLKLFTNCLQLVISLTKRFEYHIKRVKLPTILKDYLIREISDSKIITKIANYLKIPLWVYVNDPNHFEAFIEEDIITGKMNISTNENNLKSRIMTTNTNSMSRGKVIEKIKNFKIILIKILNCYGSLLRLCNEYKFKSEIEKEVTSEIYNILILVKNDPFVLSGACKFMAQILSNEDLQNDNMAMSKVMTKVYNFTILLRYINSNDSSYKGVLEKIFQYYDVELKTKTLDPYSFENITSPLLIKLFLSIINLFKIIANISLLRGSLATVANQANRSLADNKLHEYLGNCLKIQDDNLRKMSVQCIYYYDHHNIKKEVLDQIIKIISNYNSVTEGETEIILSTIYIIMTSIIISIPKNQEKESRFSLFKSVNMAIDFIKKNSDRSPTQQDENEQKNILGISLILFVNVASRFQEFNKILQPGIENEFRSIIYFDYLNFHPDFYIPIEIERTKFGNYLGILFEITRHDKAIPPFTYPFLRVLIKIADLLTNSEEFTLSVDYSEDFETLIEKLTREIRMRICYRFINEKMNWYHFNNEISHWIVEDKSVKEIIKDVEKLNRKITEIYDEEILKSDENFCYEYKKIKEQMMKDNSGEDKKMNFNNFKNLTNNSNELAFNMSNVNPPMNSFKVDPIKFNFNNNPQENNKTNDYNNNPFNNKENEKKFKPQIFNKLYLEELIKEQVNFTAYFSNLMIFILGLTSNLYEKDINKNLKEKFDPNLIHSDNIIKLIKDSNGVIDSEIFLDSNLLKSVKSNFKNNSQINNKNESLNMFMSICNNNIFKDIFNKNINEFYFDYFENDLDEFQEYGFKINQKRIQEEENVNNPHLRSLLISALSRSIYSILISPNKEVSKNFIQILFIDDKWKNLIMLIDSAKMFEYNTAHKALNIFERIYHKLQISNLFKTFSLFANKLENLQVNEEKLFHSYYVFSIYFEKLLYHYNKQFFKIEKFDFLFIKDLTITFYNFMNCLLEYKFINIENSFIQFHIYKKIIKEENIDIILYCLRSLRFLKKKAIRKLQNLFNEKLSKNINNNEIENEINNHLFYYILNTEKNIRNVIDLIAIFILVYPQCKNYILEKIINMNNHQEKAINNLQYQKLKNSKNLEKSNSYSDFKERIVIDKLKLINHKKKFAIENLIQSQKMIFNLNHLKQNYFKNSIQDQILFFEICEFNNIKTKEKILTCCVLTNHELLIFQIIKENLIKTSESFIDKLIFNLKIENIKEIFLYDYHNRIIIKNESLFFSLIFNSYLQTKSLIDYIKHYKANLKVINYNSLDSLIRKNEAADILTQRKMKEELDKKTNEDKNNHSNLNKNLENILSEFKIENNIYNNFYQSEKIEISNTFLVSNDYFTFFDYFTYLWREEGIIIKEKKIVYLSNYGLYLIKEKFDNFENLPKFELIYNDRCNVEDENLNEIIMIIPYENILSMEKCGDQSVKINYLGKDSNSNSNSNSDEEIKLNFIGDFEFDQFRLKLDAFVREVLNEDIMKKMKRLKRE